MRPGTIGMVITVAFVVASATSTNSGAQFGYGAVATILAFLTLFVSLFMSQF